jgi:hypothetical protein
MGSCIVGVSLPHAGVKHRANEPILYQLCLILFFIASGKKETGNLSTDRFSLLSCTYKYTGYHNYYPLRVDMKRRTFTCLHIQATLLWPSRIPYVGGHLRFRLGLWLDGGPSYQQHQLRLSVKLKRSLIAVAVGWVISCWFGGTLGRNTPPSASQFQPLSASDSIKAGMCSFAFSPNAPFVAYSSPRYSAATSGRMASYVRLMSLKVLSTKYAARWNQSMKCGLPGVGASALTIVFLHHSF